jgi:hypothetical protein
VEVAAGRAPFLRSDAAWEALSDPMSEVAGTSPATTRAAALPRMSLRSIRATHLLYRGGYIDSSRCFSSSVSGNMRG